ncbi:DUF3977 family protein [Enterococcus sp. HY326]|uniref:DUF3977 family protein n=1 Tax=Enterococcus sp. HY326 TaxID=2971265 RepID=UPI00223FD7B2|nr:DUF3977 family protein [Enterococcus sp. HY326]
MKKYYEIGFGNTWWCRTEIEQADGSEEETKGFVGELKFVSCYLRIWLGKKVVILDSKEGLKISTKSRRAVKLILGIHSL